MIKKAYFENNSIVREANMHCDIFIKKAKKKQNRIFAGRKC
jgi:hypothetical protein